MKWLGILLFLAAPFWETKAPPDWSEHELVMLLTESPWAEMVPPPGGGDAQPVQVYLATATPMDQAEQERDRRYRRKHPGEIPDPLVADYRGWLEENRASQIVLAVSVGKADAFSKDEETRLMEEESVMRIGRKKIKMTGHFPPSPGDPYLRLAFPRSVEPGDKKVIFELYLPGVALPYRVAEFTVKDMIVKGKLEM
jgi:hypothetical protein